MIQRELLKLLGGAAVTVSAFAPFGAAAGKENIDRPNIVLIMADDMGWSDVGCYGGEVKTPNLDRLAAEGLRFSQFYVNTVCVPTRGSLMTGLYCFVGAENVHLSPNMVTIPQLLRSAGYRTSLSGKWNVPVVGSPLDWGFEEFYGCMDTPPDYFNPPQPIMHNRKVVSEFPKDYYVTDAITDHAVETIKEFSKGDDPFFAYVGHLAPHAPFQAKPEDIQRYRGKFMEGWDLLRKKRHQRQLQMGLVDPAWQLPDMSPWDKEEHKERQDLRAATYAAMIDCMDQGIGRIMQTLRDCGADQNTIILFLSDNGGGGPWGSLHNTPFRGGKGSLHEGGIASPLIVRWPGTTKSGGAITNQFGHAMDILPTLCEVAGTEYPKQYKGQELTPCEGKSLVPVFQGKQRDGHEWLFWEHAEGQLLASRGSKAVRHGKWKLLGHGNPEDLNNWELYDLEADRTELQNLAQKYPERLKRMVQAWRDWSKRRG